MKSSLFEAAEKGDVKIIQFVLNKGLDINSRDEDRDNSTVLIIAAFYNQTEVVRFLLENEAEVDLRDNFDRTALMNTRKLEIAELLVEAGAGINLEDYLGYTPLMISINMSGELFHFLLDKGADAHCLYALLSANRPLR